jgi:hypothetical protein
MVPTRRRLLAALTVLPAAPACFAAVRGDRGGIPPGYAFVAHEFRIPAAVLYGVALQESVMLFGEPRARRPLPWPWTLNIAGTPARFVSRVAAEQRLRESLRTGVDSIDIGPMGINWRYHKERLLSVERSLDPYWNLRVGAGLLTDHFAACDNWPEAVGRYHSPGNKVRATNYSASVFARVRRLGHA